MVKHHAGVVKVVVFIVYIFFLQKHSVFFFFLKKIATEAGVGYKKGVEVVEYGCV